MDFEQADALNAAIRTIGIRHRARAAHLLAGLGLHPGQEVFLLQLAAHGPMTQAQLAASAGCEPPVVTVGAGKLEAAGFLTRRPSPQDRRLSIVELTEQGRAVVPEIKVLWQDLADQTVAGLRSTTPDVLIAALTDAAQSLRGPDGHPPESR